MWGDKSLSSGEDQHHEVIVLLKRLDALTHPDDASLRIALLEHAIELISHPPLTSL